MIKFNPEMKVRKFEIEIAGVKNVPLVMDKYDTSVKINLNPTEEQIIKYIEQKVYRNEEGEIALPTNALKGILKSMCPYVGGKMECKRNMVAIKAGVFFDSLFWVLKKQNNNSIFETYDEDMKQLRRLGFKTAYGEYELDKVYPCDGMVYRVNNNAVFAEMGYTAKAPRGAYALKERNEGADTILLDVVWQTSKSGRVTPVAILEEVTIEDAKITRATLNNVAFIEALDIQIGDMVHVIRAGSIIPCITHKVDG